MRKSLSLLVLVIAIWIGAGSGAWFPVNELQAMPASGSSVSISDQPDCPAVMTVIYPEWEIPATATVPPVSFEVSPGVHAAYLAELIKPPEFITLFWQATYSNFTLDLQDYSCSTDTRSCNYSESPDETPEGFVFRSPRDAL